MAKKKNEESSDNSALIGIGAFLIGAALAKPSQDSVQQLNQFKSNEFLFDQYKLNFHDFQQYLRDRNLFDEFKKERIIKNNRWKNLGDLKINQRVSNSPKTSNFFNEAVNMYFEGFFRSACISCTIVMEALLKNKFGDKKLVELIEEIRADCSWYQNQYDEETSHSNNLENQIFWQDKIDKGLNELSEYTYENCGIIKVDY